MFTLEISDISDFEHRRISFVYAPRKGVLLVKFCDRASGLGWPSFRATCTLALGLYMKTSLPMYIICTLSAFLCCPPLFVVLPSIQTSAFTPAFHLHQLKTVLFRCLGALSSRYCQYLELRQWLESGAIQIPE